MNTNTFGVEISINNKICFYINANSADEAKAKTCAIIDSNPLFKHFWSWDKESENYSLNVIDPEDYGYYFEEDYELYDDEPLPFVVG